MSILKQRLRASSQVKEKQVRLLHIESSDVQVADFRIGMIPLLQVFKDMEFIELPSQSKYSSTSTAVTKEKEESFPPASCQHIAWLADVPSCASVTEQDEKGCNILHHLFHIVTSSKLDANNAENLASSQMPILAGDMRVVMRQKTASFDPFGWTRAHFLCQNSDQDLKKK